MIRVLLVGNPNCGKTTLFNALTGEHQKIGNWSGVTVEQKTGVFHIQNEDIHLTDLPGVYSLTSSEEETSADQRIATHAIVHLPADIIINVIDACFLERHLYLTSQLLELGKPMIIALNMTDLAKQRGIHIDTEALANCLGCPVIILQAHREIGVASLKESIHSLPHPPSTFSLSLSPSIAEAHKQLQQLWLAHHYPPHLVNFLASRTLEGDSSWSMPECLLPPEADISMADARYQAIHALVQETQNKRSDGNENLTAKIDRVVLHRIWGLPIFLGVMYFMFFFAIHIGGVFQDFFDITTDAIFVQGSASLLQKMHMPAWVIALCADGIGKGINTTITFIPVIASMYFFLSLLESSGYMARAAFVVDKMMRLLGLPGKSFVPMIVGFGCNVPAIMAARTLDSERDRLMTIIMSPFMSCSARLAIYAVFVAAFFQTGGQNVVFSLYLIGILMAVFTGWILRKTFLKGETSSLILELPIYHKPNLRRLLKDTSLRLKYFITRAGKFIIPICVLLGGLNALQLTDGSGNSVLSWFGQCLTPFFAPMGIHTDNWPATVSLLTGALAKEVVVGSLNTLYAQAGHLVQNNIAHFNFWDAIRMGFSSIKSNLLELGQTWAHPLSNPQSLGISPPVYGIMAQRFDGWVGAYAYLLFILLYIPCVSTMAAIRQEASRTLMWFSMTWSFLLAYVVAVIFYQIATCMTHPIQSLTWVAIMISFILLFIFGMSAFCKTSPPTLRDSHAATNS